MAPALSSNWKKLQATLPTKKPSDSVPVTSKPQKRTFGEQARPTKKRKMDNGSTVIAEASPSQSQPPERINEGWNKEAELGKFVAMDCEMVGVGGEEDRSALARVSIVNFHGVQIYDSFVRPKERVTDWRTHVSGITPQKIATARDLEDVQKAVAEIIEGRILVGHGIHNDLDVLMLGHPKRDIRDTSKFSVFRKHSAGRAPSLKKLAKLLLGIEIQDGEHSSVQDARATMLLYRKHKQAFEAEVAQRFPPTSSSSTSTSAKPKRKKKTKR